MKARRSSVASTVDCLAYPPSGILRYCEGRG